MPRWESFSRFLEDAKAVDATRRQALVDELLRERPHFPWIEGQTATFVYSGLGVKSVAVNLDTIQADPPFLAMHNLPDTSLWYVQHRFASDDLLDYMLAIDDPGTPLASDKDLLGRIARHWRTDPRNPLRMTTAQAEVSLLRMPKARPLADWATMRAVPRGKIYEHEFSSVQMNFENRKLWVYTPPGYDPASGRLYPMLILFDGQWMIGPLQVPYIADALIKHGRLEPLIIVMKQSGSQASRLADYVSNDKHYAAILTELLPFLQGQYAIDSTNLGVGGVDVGAIAAAHCALKNPAVFSHLIMFSPPLGRGQAQKQLIEYAQRFENARLLPRRIFQSVGRYEQAARFYKPNLALAAILQQREILRGDVDHEYVEVGSGHSLAAFKSLIPEALAHTFPPDQA
jgi:enterochelin esterase-like enzyme